MTDLSSRIDTAYNSAISDKRIVGAVSVVMRNGEVAHRGAYGLADREANTPMKPDALFRLASLTKPVVTAAAMRMVELNQISLDDVVSDWLPDFRPKLPEGSAPAITLRQLLTHTSGLSYDFMQPPDGPYNRLKVSAGADQPGLTMEEELARATEAGLTFPPGAMWLYSIGIDVMGAVMMKAAGATLHDICDQHVFKPLGITDTGFKVADRTRLATPYANAAPEPIRVPENYQQPFLPNLAPISFSLARAFDTKGFQGGGTGMTGSADDMARILDAVRAGGTPILSQASASAMMSNQIGPLRILFDPTGGAAFGFGGSILLDPAASGSPLSPGSWQWGGVWGHSWFVDPARRLTIVNLTNTMLEGMSGQLPRDVLAAVLA
jgi:CubicO group peptidase (beta-lactamase class C family)